MATQPAERTLETEIFGRPVSYDYSETWVGYSTVGLRMVMAWVFLQAGLSKLVDPEWSAAGYTDPSTPFGVTEANPFAGLFADFSANTALVDPLVIWGQLLIGIALLFGVLLRFAVFWGVVQLFLFWLASLQGGLGAGLPVEHGWVVNSDIVYILLLFGLGRGVRAASSDSTLDSKPPTSSEPTRGFATCWGDRLDSARRLVRHPTPPA